MNQSRRVWLCAGPVMLAAALAGCASPPARYYRLAAIPGAPRNAPALTVDVRSVSIPGYLDQNGIAKRGEAYLFSVYPNDLWADELADMLQAVMVQDLAQRLPGAMVLGSGGSIDVSSDVLIEIDVLRFDPDGAGNIVLDAQVAIKSGRDRAVLATQGFTRSAAPDGQGVPGIVATMSMLWGAMADLVAEIIVENGAGRIPAGSGAG